MPQKYVRLDLLHTATF